LIGCGRKTLIFDRQLLIYLVAIFIKVAAAIPKLKACIGNKIMIKIPKQQSSFAQGFTRTSSINEI